MINIKILAIAQEDHAPLKLNKCSVQLTSTISTICLLLRKLEKVSNAENSNLVLEMWEVGSFQSDRQE